MGLPKVCFSVVALGLDSKVLDLEITSDTLKSLHFIVIETVPNTRAITYQQDEIVALHLPS